MLKKILPVALTAIVFCFSLVHITSSQKKPLPKLDRVMRHRPAPEDPIKIIKVKNKRGPVNLGANTLDDDEWLEGLTVTVKNTSGKSIVFVDLELFFKDPRKPPGLDLSAFPVSYGRSAPPEPATVDVANMIAPGEIVDVVLVDGEYASLRTFLDNLDYPKSIKETDLRIHEVIFDDNTKWESGSLFRRDPNNPNEWHFIGLASGGVAAG